MALALKLYQQRALQRLERYLEAARLGNPAAAFAATVDEGLAREYRALPRLPSVPYVCLRIPTGGGKTVLGAHFIRIAARTLLERQYPLVLWMVPTTQIRSQTLDALRNPRHPYRQELDETFGGQVAIFDIGEYARIRPADIATRVCVVIATAAAFRVEETADRKVYQHHEDLEPHFAGVARDLGGLVRGPGGEPIASFANLLRLHGPLVLVDEAHNFITDLSYEVHERLGPRAVVEMTATPDASSSNVLVSVSAFELKSEDMIKFPVILTEHAGEWQAAVASAVARRRLLATLARDEPDYIRPILLVQAENSRGTATVAQVKQHLVDSEGVAEAAIAVATGDQRELDGVDLFAPECPIEVVITKQALKEGWDCSFAYVFCSVAQIHSDRDVQQLLGRVLRMPHATRRRQAALNRAYAHVVSDGFGRAAGELLQSLVGIGFDPLEAAAAIRREPQGALALEGGALGPPAVPVTRIAVVREPDLADIPERDQQHVSFVPNDRGRGGNVEIRDAIDQATVDAIVTVVRGDEQRAEAIASLGRHNDLVAAARAPSERGASFQVPRLCTVEQGELELLDRSATPVGFTWDLLEYPADLGGFRFSEETATFEVDLAGRRLEYHQVRDDAGTYLRGFEAGRSETDLLGWLDQEVRDPSVRQPVLREWLRCAVRELIADRGFSLAQLLKGRFILRRKLAEQLQIARDRATAKGFQQALFAADAPVTASDEPGVVFEYPPDMARYPARWYYAGSFRFRKHFYPKPGHLAWRTPGGALTEEFECAQALDSIEEVEFWVRNLVHDSQYWMPTSRQRTYPDFVARLRDGRLLVVEYKGEDRYTSDEEREKRLVGELWAGRSGGKGLYLMARKRDDAGFDVREQILRVIARSAS